MLYILTKPLTEEEIGAVLEPLGKPTSVHVILTSHRDAFRYPDPHDPGPGFIEEDFNHEGRANWCNVCVAFKFPDHVCGVQ